VSSIHSTAAIGFDRGGADYERGRPGYPAQAVALLTRELAIGPGSQVVDLAAGTGKLTRALVGLGAELVAVEPVAGMREQLLDAVPSVKVLAGTAEHIPLPDASVDAVLVAQAFHWFDAPAAAAEIYRVLVPGGGLAVIRNDWDRSVPWVDEMQALVRSLRFTDTPSQATSRWREQVESTGLFTTFCEQVVPNDVQGDLDTVLARVASSSFVAARDEAEREALLGEVRQILERHGVAPGEPLSMPHRTHILWARRER
jgi:SAM-dependent methyltransferase